MDDQQVSHGVCAAPPLEPLHGAACLRGLQDDLNVKTVCEAVLICWLCCACQAGSLHAQDDGVSKCRSALFTAALIFKFWQAPQNSASLPSVQVEAMQRKAAYEQDQLLAFQGVGVQ